MNIFKFLENQVNKGNTFVTYDGEIINSAKAETEAKKSYLIDLDANKDITFEQYKKEWVDYNTVTTKDISEVISQLFAESN